MKTILILLFLSTPVFADLGDCTPERVRYLDSAMAWADSVDRAGIDSVGYLNKVAALGCDGEVLEFPQLSAVTVDTIAKYSVDSLISWKAIWVVVETGEIIYFYTYMFIPRNFVACWSDSRQQRIWWIAR